MTCIAAIEDNGSVWMAGDRASSNGNLLTVGYNPKIFTRNVDIISGDKIMIGVAGSHRMHDLLLHELKIPKKEECDSDDYYIKIKLIKSIREVSEKHVIVKKDEPDGVSHALVGYNGKIYTIYSDYQANRNSNGMSAIGCGYMYAFGAMQSLKDEGSSYDYIVKKAVLAACKFDPGVREPVDVMKLEKLNGR